MKTVRLQRVNDMGFWKCFWYLIITGVIAFFAGRLLPKNWFRPDLFPYRCCKFEKDGQIYDKLNIRKWQNKVPDMSRILPKWMPAKNLSGNFRERMPRMLQETCVAEFIHSALCVTGLRCLKLYPGIGGVIIVLLYIVVFNLPFIIIQRYNRPRLMKLLKRIQTIEEKQTKGEKTVCEC